MGILYLISVLFLSVEKGHAEPEEADILTRDLLDTNKCYILDCGNEVFVWMGSNTTLDDRKSSSGAAEVKLDPYVLFHFVNSGHISYSCSCVGIASEP